MRISFIGAGRVAHHLAQAFNTQHQIINIYSRSFEKANLLAEKVDAKACEKINELDRDVDVVVIAVSDQAIANVISEISIHFNQVLIVHTSGSTHINVLADKYARSGVFYPLQTFSLERNIDWLNTPLFVEASRVEDLKMLSNLAHELSQHVYEYDSEQRLSLHLAAVFACNFSNYCYDMAKQIVDEKHVDFSLLYPLILETAQKATLNDPKAMQTGPAMRGDQNILNMHQQMLADQKNSELSDIYTLLSHQILNRHRS